MLIGELVKKTGLSRDTIRFYEKQKLIAVGKKERRFNNYKEYSEENLERLLVIKRMKGFGFTLNEISDFLGLLKMKAASCENVSQKMLEKAHLIDIKIKELEEIKKLMLNGITSCESCCPTEKETENCLILTTDNFSTKRQQ